MKIQDLYESKSAPLYHATKALSAINILKNNVIQGRSWQRINDQSVCGISTTRSFQYAKKWMVQTSDFGGVIFKLDQEKLARNYKIKPVDYWMIINPKNKSRSINNCNESEEFIITKQINNFNSYVLQIFIDTKAKEYFKANAKEGDKTSVMLLNNPKVVII